VTRGGYLARSPSECSFNVSTQASPPELPRIDWIVAGGESGRDARPMHPNWVRSIRDQCAAAGVAFHFKQHGAWLDADQATAQGHAPGPHMFDTEGRPTGRRWHFYDPDDRAGGAMILIGKKAAGRLLDGRTHDEWPARHLRKSDTSPHLAGET